MGKKTKVEQVEDGEILNRIVMMIYEDLLAEKGRFKVAELLKALEVKRKLAPGDDKGEVFWDMIEQLRVDELPGPASDTAKPKTKSAKSKRKGASNHRSQAA